MSMFDSAITFESQFKRQFIFYGMGGLGLVGFEGQLL